MKYDSYKEWAKRPSWHGDYSDYVRHMENEARIQQKEMIEQLIEKAIKNHLKEG